MDKLQYLTHIWEYLHPYYDSLNIPYITHYIFFHSTLIDTVLYPQFLLTLSSFFHHLFLLLSDLIILFYYFLIYFHKILFILIPYCIEFLQIVIQYHQTYLTFHEIILEIVIISLIIFYWIFKKKIILLWQYYSTKVSKKYQQLALIFPHLLFFFTASIIAIYGQKFLLPLSSPQIFPFFILICPLIYSFYLWKQNRSSPPATPPSQSDSNATSTSPTPSIDIIKYNKLQQDMVVLWTIIGSYLAISSLLTMIPFSNYFLHFIPAIREFSLVIAIWIQISPICANLVFESTIPFIHYYTNQIPVADLASNSGVSQILNTLRFFGLPESILSSIRGLLHDSGALIIAIIFFFLPFNLSKIGALIISLLLPAYKSSLVIVEMRNASEKKSSSSSSSNPSEGNQSTLTKSFHLLTSYLPFMKSSSQEKQQPPPPINKIQFWLEYWMCLATLSLLQIYGIAKFWPTSLMILTLWLQNSHFHGASLVFQWSGKFINELVNYEKTRSKTVTTPAAPVVTENGTTDTSPSPPEEITQRTLPSDSQEEIIRSNSNPHVDFQEKDSNSEIMNTSTTPLVVAVSSRKYDEEEEVQDSPSPQITNQSQEIEIESTNTLSSSSRMTSDEPVS